MAIQKNGKTRIETPGERSNRLQIRC
jgi:hypothetical protein